MTGLSFDDLWNGAGKTPQQSPREIPTQGTKQPKPSTTSSSSTGFQQSWTYTSKTEHFKPAEEASKDDDTTLPSATTPFWQTTFALIRRMGINMAATLTQVISPVLWLLTSRGMCWLYSLTLAMLLILLVIESLRDVVLTRLTNLISLPQTTTATSIWLTAASIFSAANSSTTTQQSGTPSGFTFRHIVPQALTGIIPTKLEHLHADILTVPDHENIVEMIGASLAVAKQQAATDDAINDQVMRDMEHSSARHYSRLTAIRDDATSAMTSHYERPWWHIIDTRYASALSHLSQLKILVKDMAQSRTDDSNRLQTLIESQPKPLDSKEGGTCEIKAILKGWKAAPESSQEVEDLRNAAYIMCLSSLRNLVLWEKVSKAVKSHARALKHMTDDLNGFQPADADQVDRFVRDMAVKLLEDLAKLTSFKE